jgi:hypothetical protein
MKLYHCDKPPQFDAGAFLLSTYQRERNVTMVEQMYTITFDAISAADANRYAEELRQALLDAEPDVQVHRRRDDPHTQDIGSTLVLILEAPATVALVTAIGNWLALRNRAAITVKKADEQIVIENITSKKVGELAQLLLRE